MTIDETGPVSGIEITTARHQRIEEIATARLRVSDFVDEFYLDDLRRLVEAAADIPGDAIVRPHENGIDITYTKTEYVADAAEQPIDGVTVMSDERLARIRAHLERECPADDEPAIDGPEDFTADRERDERIEAQG